jgi:hypothetical protein
MKKSTNDRIRASAHTVATALQEVDAMDDVTMREIDKLCCPPAPDTPRPQPLINLPPP